MLRVVTLCLLVFLSACATLPETPIVYQIKESENQRAEQLLTLFDEQRTAEQKNNPSFFWALTPADEQRRLIKQKQTLRTQLLELTPEYLSPMLHLRRDAAAHTLTKTIFELQHSPLLLLQQRPSELIHQPLLNTPIESIAAAKSYIQSIHSSAKLIHHWQALLNQELHLIQGLTEWVLTDLSEETEHLIAASLALQEDFQFKLSKLALYDKSQQMLEQQLKQAITRQLIPAYQALNQRFISLRTQTLQEESEYRSPYQGIYPLYVHLYSLSSKKSAATLHTDAQAEVIRLNAALNKLQPLFETTELLPSQQPLLERLQQVTEGLPHYFSQIPSTPLKLSHYQQRTQYFGSTFTLQLNERETTNATTLAYLSIVPFLHLQYSYPNHQDNNMLTLALPTYLEGWKLYNHQRMNQLMPTSNVLESYGHLLAQLEAYSALVVETGMHEKHWSLEQAQQFLDTNTQLSSKEIDHLLSRILLSPGSALPAPLGAEMWKTLEELDKIRPINTTNENKEYAYSIMEYALSQGALPSPKFIPILRIP